MKNLSRILGLLGLGLLTACAAWAVDYKITRVDPNGSSSTSFSDINNVGQIVGTSRAQGQTDYKAFVLQGSQYSYLSGPAGALGSFGGGISDSGVVVGSYYTSTTIDASGSVQFGPSRGFVYSGGQYSSLDIAGGSNTSLNGISPDGRYVSGSYDALDANGNFLNSQAFIFDRQTNTNTLVGQADPYGYTVLHGINSRGLVAAWEMRVDDNTGSVINSAFSYDIHSSTRTEQTFAGLTRVRLDDINDAGIFAGYSWTSGVRKAFVGTAHSFQQLLIEGAYVSGSLGINNANDVVGFYTDALGIDHGFIATTVPEPQTWALFLAGAGLLMLRRRVH